MRLLYRVDGQLKFINNQDLSLPYIALSHTWGEEEITYADVCSGRLEKAGFRKIEFALSKAEYYGHQYVWIDTCCIDKTSNSELSEAINRMWQWYAQSTLCFVYLTDVEKKDQIRYSRWFKRGWTLQELVAPKYLRFFNTTGGYLGDQNALRHEILVACGVDIRMALDQVPLSERFRWSIDRQTTIGEDASYCMLGLLEVKLIFNYGEDAARARERLFQAVVEEHGKRVVREMQQILTDHAQQENLQRGKVVEGMSEAALLRELEFDVEYRRWQAINDPYAGTCTWILSHPDFQRWSQGELQLLWIKGKAGSGKSTLIKFIESQAQGTHIAFYFNARGELIEHSTLGMYRSILAQLMRRTSISSKVLSHVNQQILQGVRWALTIPMLQSTIKFAVSVLSEPVECYIDALDECDKREVQEMVNYFGAISSQHLRICFASRHYPAMTIPRSVEIALEKQHHSDIGTLVRGRLAVDEDPYGLAQHIIDKANGVFFWAVLVVNLLNDDLSNGNMYQVEQRLHTLPGELEDLLEEITLSNPHDELQRFRLCLYWLLYGFRPLKADEFYSAVVTGLCAANLASRDAYLKDMTSVSTLELEKFVSSSSRGLAEVAPDLTVQVVHESVRDYLLHHGGMQRLHAQQDMDVESLAHDQLKATLIHHISTPAMYAIASDATSSQRHLTRPFPLMGYVGGYTVLHAERAAKSISQKEFLRYVHDLATAKSAVLRFFAQELPRFWAPPDLVLCLVANNAAQLIRMAHQLQISIKSDITSPLALALSGSALDAYDALLGCEADLDGSHNGETALGLLVQQQQAGYERATLLLELGANANRSMRNGDTYLTAAVREKDADMVKLLLKYGADVNAVNKSGKTALHNAIEVPPAMAELLLDTGAKIHAVWTDAEGVTHTALTLAVEGHHHTAVKVLLNRGANIEDRMRGSTPLLHACQNKDVRMVKILLDDNASLEARNDYGLTPLLVAAKHKLDARALAIMTLLIEHGADVAAVDRDNKNVRSTVIGVKYDEWALGHRPYRQELLEKIHAVEQGKPVNKRVPIPNVKTLPTVYGSMSGLTAVAVDGKAGNSPVPVPAHLDPTDIKAGSALYEVPYENLRLTESNLIKLQDHVSETKPNDDLGTIPILHEYEIASVLSSSTQSMRTAFETAGEEPDDEQQSITAPSIDVHRPGTYPSSAGGQPTFQVQTASNQHDDDYDPFRDGHYYR